jgi:hypothetical protein
VPRSRARARPEQPLAAPPSPVRVAEPIEAVRHLVEAGGDLGIGVVRPVEQLQGLLVPATCLEHPDGLGGEPAAGVPGTEPELGPDRVPSAVS